MKRNVAVLAPLIGGLVGIILLLVLQSGRDPSSGPPEDGRTSGATTPAVTNHSPPLEDSPEKRPGNPPTDGLPPWLRVDNPYEPTAEEIRKKLLRLKDTEAAFPRLLARAYPDTVADLFVPRFLDTTASAADRIEVLRILRPLAEVGNERVRDAVVSQLGSSGPLMDADLSRYLFRHFGADKSVQAVLRTRNPWYGALFGDAASVRMMRERKLSPWERLMLEAAVKDDDARLGQVLLDAHRASGRSQAALGNREMALHLVAARGRESSLEALRKLVDAEKARISKKTGIDWEERFNADEFCRNDFLYRAVLIHHRLGGKLTRRERDSLTAVGVIGNPRRIVPASAFR